ncbi:uncharacterized protein PHACADRAFT_150298 [Phanerochaete carnosa HHB-10118-sp]|uniref:Cytochrome P450 n=1 Tax=Phanerochaete carnosa (strain HHB-10118-sp) TaxID=650164 RepID=K5VYJ8_PHACS|nr:uncharacterized protein PHACADRAFT_150298 [Phanerochaete carnosa HHB-10118-sp]EKM51684.1 hypothetical protein PHACADRAFT_150298 [Phanerochaete carnosa HHB-10118-sp]
MSLPLAFFVAGLVLLFVSSRQRQRSYPLPPGPRRLPLVGSILDVPKENAHLVLQRWSRAYGSDVLYFEILGTHYVVLNSCKATVDLFERRSNVYSDKIMEAQTDLSRTGWGRNWGMMKYGNYWREHRKMFHQHFRERAVPAYRPRSTRAVRQMLRSLCETPERFKEHISFLTACNVLGTMYGIDVKPEGDPILGLIEDALRIFSAVANPGVYLGALVRFLPAWFPSAKFKRDAAAWSPMVEEMYLRPYREVKAAFEAGTAPPCVTTEILAELCKDRTAPIDPILEEVVINTVGTGYGAAVDTTSAALESFILAMMLFPEAQRLAQEELDHVLGNDRLPEFDDRDSLPYVTAIMKEVLRWRPPGPLGVPHKSTRADEYAGYYIPAGSVIIGNIWAILHDEERYPDAESFKPARFLDSNGQLCEDVPDAMEVFGFGRRLCPGRYFVLDTIWLSIASVLTSFNIERPVDESGNVIEPTAEYTSGLISHPLPFKVAFKRRGCALLDM